MARYSKSFDSFQLAKFFCGSEYLLPDEVIPIVHGWVDHVPFYAKMVWGAPKEDKDLPSITRVLEFKKMGEEEQKEEEMVEGEEGKNEKEMNNCAGYLDSMNFQQ